MKRRTFISLIGAASVASLGRPFAARAQQPSRVRRIGVLMTYAESNQEGQSFVAAFREGLGKLGWSEGRNIHIDYRWAAVDAELTEKLAKELVALPLEVIFTNNTPTAAALQRQTRTIPIVFGNVADPVGSGFVASLARPGGNLTGFTALEPTLPGKLLQLLREIAPGVERAAFLFNPQTAPYADYYLGPFKAAAKAMGVEPTTGDVRSMPECASVVAGLAAHGGLIVAPDTFMTAHRAELIALVNQHRVPTIFPFRYYSEFGGLMSYGVDLIDQYRRSATYVDRILKGARPAELPVQAPTAFHLAINLRTARSIGLTVPPMLVARADEVLE